MTEQFLQTVQEFVKEIWFQLDSRFDLEKTEAFKFFKPYLIQLQDNLLYIGISIATLFFVPYVLIKVKINSSERERKLDELMEQMEEEEKEEYDEDDPRRLRRPDKHKTSAEVDGNTEKPLFANDDNDNTSSDIDVLNKIKGKADSTDEEFELDQSPSDNEETTNIEENAEPVSSQLAESELDKDLEEFELDPSPSDNEETINIEENAEPVSSQLAESELDKDLNEFISLEENKEPGNIDDSSHNQAIKELQEDGELMELDDHLSGNDPLGDFLELNENDQDKIIIELQEEKERAFRQSTKQVNELTEPHSPIKDLNQTRIDGDSTIDDDQTDKETPSPQEEPSPVSELSDSEISASLEPALENVLNHETKYKEEPIAIPKTSDYDPELAEFTFDADSMSFEKIPEPELDTPTSPLGETDSLIDRLKFLQTRFENRYQPSERSPEPAPSQAHIEKSIAAKDYVNFTESRRYSSSPASPPPDSEKYMDLLESFVFMKDQKKHK